MAEIALGGVQVTVGARRRVTPDTCPHPTTLSATTNGLERVVCEVCGHLSVSYTLELTAPVSRERFARPADSFGEAGRMPARDTAQVVENRHQFDGSPYTPIGAFARQERLHIRSRYEAHPPSVAFA
jgi:hypothetical protein